MDPLLADGRRVRLTRAIESEVGEIVSLLADDELGRLREATDLDRYSAAFRAIDSDERHLVLVARVGDQEEIVGTMQLTIIPGLARNGSTRLQIEAVRVAEQVRGVGLGAVMFEFAHEHGRRQGAEFVQLTSDKSRTCAHRFYEGLGYRASHEGFKRQL